MLTRLSTIVAFVWLVQPAPATEKPRAPVVMDGPSIIKAFDGKTLKGVYADGTPVQETYLVGGKIDYWDVTRVSTGNWSVVNNLLCTFYDSTEMSGACFRIEQVSANCFDYLALANSEAEALAPSDKPRYTARASIVGLPATCPDELSV